MQGRQDAQSPLASRPVALDGVEAEGLVEVLEWAAAEVRRRGGPTELVADLQHWQGELWARARGGGAAGPPGDDGQELQPWPPGSRPEERIRAYLTNRLLESTEPGVVTDAERQRLAELGLEAYYVELQTGERGLLLTEEVEHAECEDTGDQRAAVGATLGDAAFCWHTVIRPAAQRLAAAARDMGIGRVYAGYRSRPFGRHEIAVFLPVQGLTRQIARAWVRRFHAIL